MSSERGNLQEKALTILRVGGGALFMQHGIQKLFGLLGGRQVDLLSIMGLAGVIEFFGGLAIVLGFKTRPVAGVAALEMAIAYLWRHQPEAIFPIQNAGELALLYMVVFLYLAARGGGPHSLDAR